LLFSQTIRDELDLKREKEREREGKEKEKENPKNIFPVSKFGRKVLKFPFSSRNSGGKYLTFRSRLEIREEKT
jgi:hypothetical protein